MIRFILNEKETQTDLPPGTVLLDLIRYHQNLTGTKIGCREGDCGACTVLVGQIVEGELKYESMTSCLLPLGNVHGKHVVSIEGVNFPDRLNPVQQAMSDCGATQCGFCTPGFVMSLAGFCLSGQKSTKENAIAAVDGNICRCTGYKSIERAAEIVAALTEKRNGQEPAVFVAGEKILPAYFSAIKSKLEVLKTENIPYSDASASTAVGGGTDLYVQKHDQMTHADIRFVADNPHLKRIEKVGNNIVLGPAVTVTDMQHSALINEIFPSFHRYAKLISSTPIRNMATIAGNFVNASPIGDFTIFFLALDAQLELSDGASTRQIPLRKFYQGYKKLYKSPAEIISKIYFKIPGKNAYFNFEKVSKRTHLDIATVNTAILLEMNGDTIEHASIAAGGVGPVPLYLEKTSVSLINKKITDDTIDASINMMTAEISPISDVRGSKEYKTLLLAQFIKAHFAPLVVTNK